MTTAADWLLTRLADLGVEVVFGNPGSTELPLVDAFARQDRVAFVLGLHEAAVLGMADGYAQQGDRLAVVNLHVQPGLANGLAGVLNAERARVPILVTVGQQVTALKDRAPFLGGELVGMAAPVARDALEVERVDDLPDALERLVRTATGDPRGPVVLSLPMDVLAGPVPDRAAAVAGTARVSGPNDLGAGAALLGAANAPAIALGDGVVHEGATDLAIALAERVGAPIYGEPFAARVPVPTRHPLWRGPLPGFAVEINARLAEHDVLCAVGMPVFRLFGESPGQALPAGCRLLHLDADPGEIGRTHEPAAGIVGSVAVGLRGLLAALGDPVSVSAVGRGERLRGVIVAERADAAARLAADAVAGGGTIVPAALCQAIAATVEPDDLVVDEALTSGRWLRTALIARNRPDNWLAHRGSALGWGLPAAVGAKLAEPDRRVLCVHGDGSFLFGMHALWTAARELLGVAVVIADNGGYEILRAGLEGLTGRAEGGWPGLAIANPPLDLCALARGFGASAERVEEVSALPAALDDLWARAADAPAVLVVAVTGRTPPVGYPLN